MLYLVGSSLILRLPVDSDTLNPRRRQAFLLLLHLLQQNLQLGLRQALEPFLKRNQLMVSTHDFVRVHCDLLPPFINIRRFRDIRMD
jgi:hypothetical protein